jgi:hypothetical protein
MNSPTAPARHESIIAQALHDQAADTPLKTAQLGEQSRRQLAVARMGAGLMVFEK